MSVINVDSKTLARHASLSKYNALFLKNALEDARYTGKSDFKLPFFPGVNVGWPTFVDSAVIQGWARVATALKDAVLDAATALLPATVDGVARLFGYATDATSVRMRYLRDPQCLEPLISRADLLFSESGVRVCELNFGNVGGWEIHAVGTFLRETPLIEEFLRRSGVELRQRDPLRSIAAHVLQTASRKKKRAQYNLGFLLRDDTTESELEVATFEAAYASSVYGPALEALGAKGEIKFGRVADFECRGGTGWLAGEPIAAVITECRECWDGAAALIEATERGDVSALTSPASTLLSNKILLALVSEASEEQNGMSDASRRMIRAHLPWTRRLLETRTTFGDDVRWIPDLLLAQKDLFVLKPGYGRNGSGVTIGCRTSASEWGRALEHALVDGHWVAQEAVRGFSMMFPRSEGGMGLENMNLGPFLLGEYAGAFLRVAPARSGDDAALIAGDTSRTGAIFEVIDEPRRA